VTTPAAGPVLPVKLTRVNRRRLLVLLTGATNIGGATIWHLAGGMSGRVWFGFLDQLEDAGLVIGEWETPEPQDHPRRRFYRLTPEGRDAAMAALKLKTAARVNGGVS
jgi:Transcriptional regulator PadR-like family